MAEYGIVMKIDEIKGNCQLEGYKEAILVSTVSFGSGAHRMQTGLGSSKGRTSVNQSAVTLMVMGGKWVAELQNALYTLQHFPKVEIVQLGQAIDPTTVPAPEIIQKLTLTNAVLTSVDQGWTADAGGRYASLSFEFDKFLLEIGQKSAAYVLRNITEGAK